MRGTEVFAASVTTEVDHPRLPKVRRRQLAAPPCAERSRVSNSLARTDRHALGDHLTVTIRVGHGDVITLP